MTPEQLQAAYDEGYAVALHDSEGAPAAPSVRRRVAETAGLAEVARQQAERDAGIAETLDAKSLHDARVGDRIADVIRAQFANPSTTPKETR